MHVAVSFAWPMVSEDPRAVIKELAARARRIVPSVSEHERVIPGHSPPDVVGEHVERYLFAGPLCRGRRVLDLACGSGYGAAFLALTGASWVVAADVSRETVELARSLYGDVSNLTFVVMDGEAQAFRSDTFEAVVSFETLEHLRTPTSLLAEFSRILRARGQLIISTPNKLILCAPSGWRRPFVRASTNPFHQIEWTQRQFEKLLATFFRAPLIGGQRLLPSYYGSYLLAALLFSFPTRIRLAALQTLDRRLSEASLAVTMPITGRTIPAFMIAVCVSQK